MTPAKSQTYFISALLFVYILLFEFILPINRIFPKPSLLIDSFSSIWSDYKLFQAFGLTTTVIYVGLILAYIAIVLKSRFIIMFSLEFKESIETIKILRFVPIIFLAAFFAVWFNDSIWAEFLFTVIIYSFLIGGQLINQAGNVKQEYIDVGRNLGLSKNKIYSKIIWKALEPEIAKSMINSHLILWGLVIIYEYVTTIGGLGGALFNSVTYQDYTAIFMFIILTAILIYIGNFIIIYIVKRFVTWEQ